ncbi:helix-turn-helix transcriptional regulator [Streptomyces sp. NPDC048057]|uniref:helix-turn-helix domain-containing protein n=1 Tax=Streptomyces sp. NPDC048057 TaxID=3155628 RepID=UPI0033F88DA5
MPETPAWISDSRQRLGDRIRAARLYAGHTQEVFAEMAGIDRRTLQRIEAGTSDPPYGRLLRIARALDVPLAVLVADDAGE